MFNHGIITTALFLLVGFIAVRRGTTQLGALRGLQGPAPVLAAAFTVAMLASIGLPGLSGFVGEFLILLGFFGAQGWWAVIPTLGVIVAAIYLLWAYQQAFQGPALEANADVADLTWAERGVVAPLLAIMVILGVYPKLVLDRILPSVNHLLAHAHVLSGALR
jgi:NADH-quinone oxidoreductase subunit M